MATPPFADRWSADVFSGVGTLGGIHAGLQAATHDRALVVGCDMPLSNPAMLAWFADAVDGYDLVVLKQGE
ncbi:MAG: NTP transferase domain-containing protein [Anaerolineae bacterium]